MNTERLQMSIQTVKDNITILENQEPEDAGYYLQLEHEKMVLDALEKRMPKKPQITTHKYRQENTEELAERKMTHCPDCFWEDEKLGYFDSLVDKGTKYCRRCGQALDWSDYPTEKGGESDA